MRTQPCWRLNPDLAVHHAVESLARREARSVSSMLTILVKEALNQRRQADGAVDSLVAAFRKVSP
jgi:hypothetical protein